MSLSVRIQRRAVPATREPLHDHPLLHDILAARGVEDPCELKCSLGDLPLPGTLRDIEPAVRRLLLARERGETIIVIGDYDCDGATSTAVAVLGLEMLGFNKVRWLVPDRFRFGYGLSPAIVDLAVSDQSSDGAIDSGVPETFLIVTVDNGVASVDGVERARELNIDVVVTDHHLPPAVLPRAVAIVNPSIPGATFPGRSLAGVGVIFYVLLALRSALGNKASPSSHAVRLADLLDLVAIGTVADMVPLDRINRILVEQGLRRIRQGATRPGVLALLNQAGRDPARLSTDDIGFALAPRLNAAGRLDNMRIGIECLLASDRESADALATELDSLNQRRRDIEMQMRAEADQQLKALSACGAADGTASGPAGGTDSGTSDGTSDKGTAPLASVITHLNDALPAGGPTEFGLCLQHPDWHQGVIGILAGRIKQQLNRPVIVFAHDSESPGKGAPVGSTPDADISNARMPDGSAPDAHLSGGSSPDESLLKGSARSIAGVHIRDVLQAIAAQQPGLIEKFGGHAMAAGLSLQAKHFAEFALAFDREVRRVLGNQLPKQEFLTDGALPQEYLTLDIARSLKWLMPWGQQFEAPRFDNAFRVQASRTVGIGHLKLRLQTDHGELIDAIAFHCDIKVQPGDAVHLVYALDINRWRDSERLQLLVQHIEPVALR